MSELADKARGLQKEASTAGEFIKRVGNRFRVKAPKMDGADKYKYARALKKKMDKSQYNKGLKKGVAVGAIAGGTTVGLLAKARNKRRED